MLEQCKVSLYEFSNEDTKLNIKRFKIIFGSLLFRLILFYHI